jgi:hypothetical protein
MKHAEVDKAYIYLPYTASYLQKRIEKPWNPQTIDWKEKKKN